MVMQFDAPPFATTDPPVADSLEDARAKNQCTLGPSHQALGVIISSYNALIDLQLFYRDTPRGVRPGPITRGVAPLANQIFPGAVGFIACSHVAGTPAEVIAQVWETTDGPMPSASAPNNASLSSGGILSPFRGGGGSTAPYQGVLSSRGLVSETFFVGLLDNVNGFNNPETRAGLIQDKLAVGTVITGVALELETAAVGAAPTNAQVAIATPVGNGSSITPIAVSANLGASAAWTSTGPQQFPLSAPYTVLGGAANDQVLYALYCVAGTWGTTQPRIGYYLSNTFNGFGLGAAGLRTRGDNFIIASVVVGTAIALSAQTTEEPWFGLY